MMDGQFETIRETRNHHKIEILDAGYIVHKYDQSVWVNQNVYTCKTHDKIWTDFYKFDKHVKKGGKDA